MGNVTVFVQDTSMDYGFKVYDRKVAKWHVNFDYYFDVVPDNKKTRFFNHYRKLLIWASESCTGEVFIIESDSHPWIPTISFELEEDAMLFKLSWL